MSQVINNPKELSQLALTINIIGTSGKNLLSDLFQSIENLKNSGNLEIENFEQLISSEYLGGEFQLLHNDAYEIQINKMQQFLNELELKLNDYLKIR